MGRREGGASLRYGLSTYRVAAEGQLMVQRLHMRRRLGSDKCHPTLGIASRQQWDIEVHAAVSSSVYVSGRNTRKYKVQFQQMCYNVMHDA